MNDEIKCKDCGKPFSDDPQSDEYSDWDGYHIDCWPGYDSCADPRCNHYRCEHDLHLGPAIYLAPGIDPATVPECIDINGCANADCPCEKFREWDVK